jgi:hypothetical protein
VAKNIIHNLSVIWKRSKPSPLVWEALSAQEKDAAITRIFEMDNEPFAALLAAMDDPHAAAGTYLALILGESRTYDDSLADALKVAAGVADDLPLTPAIHQAIVARIDQLTNDHAAFAALEAAYNG